jgi:hypothetical protein
MSFVCTPPSMDEILKLQKASKEATIAGQFAGTGVPLLDSVLSNLKQAISTPLNVAVSAGMTELVSKVQEGISKQLGTLGATAIANITSILNLAAESKIAGYGFVISALKKQIKLRHGLLRELDFHLNGMLSILRQLNQTSKAQDTRLQRAYPFIKAGYINLSRVQTLLEASKPRFNPIIYREVSTEIDNALGILIGNTSIVKNYLGKIRKGTPVNTAFKNYITDTIIKKTAMLVEVYLWHLENLVAIPTGGFDVKSPSATSDNSLLMDRQAQLNLIKKDLYNTLKNDEGILGTLAWVDSNKGLILTNEAAKASIATLQNYESDWSALTTSSKTLWTILSPSLGILQTVEAQVRKALSQGNTPINNVAGNVDSTMLIAGVTSQLTIAKQLLLLTEKQGIAYEMTASDYAALDNIVTYLNSAEYASGVTALTAILKQLLTALGMSLQATISKGTIQRAVVLFRTMDLECKTAIREDIILLKLLNSFNIMGTPGILAIGKSIQALSTQGAVGAMVAKSFSSGNLQQITDLMTNVGAAVSGGASSVSNTLTSIFKDCNKVNNNVSAVDNAKINATENAFYKREQEANTKAISNQNIDYNTWIKEKLIGF